MSAMTCLFTYLLLQIMTISRRVRKCVIVSQNNQPGNQEVDPLQSESQQNEAESATG